MNSELREKISQWLTAPDTCYLLGAGCSVCADKPMIGELTKMVLECGDQPLRDHFNALKTDSTRSATIEDLVNYLVRYKDILYTVRDTDIFNISAGEIDRWLKDIMRNIVKNLDDGWKPSEYHKRFLQRLIKQPQSIPRDIFTLNYDTVIEASLDTLQIPYLDGFRGSNRAWFDSHIFDQEWKDISYRIFKLHGSINWIRDSNKYVRRIPNPTNYESEDPVVVYPSEQKYIQTQYGVYEELLKRFRDRLRSSKVNNSLVVLGYSFNDEHINHAICDAINSRDNNLTVFAFVGQESYSEQQIKKFESIAEDCDSRFNAFIGNKNGRFIGNSLDLDSAKEVLNAELWIFENLVDFFARPSS